MRFVFFALVGTVAALAQPTTRVARSLNPPSVSPDFHGWDATPVEYIPSTNAERFARGLPPLSPKSRRRHHAHLAASRVRSAPGSETSPGPPVSVSCNILVTETNGAPLGYVSPSWNEYGEYGALQMEQAGALEVSFSYPVNSPYELTMVATNSPSSNYPNVGGALGFSSDPNEPMGSGQINYAYIVGTTNIRAGAGPQNVPNSYTTATGFDSGSESAIWTFDPVTKAITAQWINVDGSSPKTEIILISGVLVLTGDPDATSMGLAVDVTVVNFKCASPALPL